jgi:hypothetical protein
MADSVGEAFAEETRIHSEVLGREAALDETSAGGKASVVVEAGMSMRHSTLDGSMLTLIRLFSVR